MKKDQNNRRKNPPKALMKNERREDMKIIVSASEKDIYTWAVSIAIMASILTIIISFTISKG